MAKKPTNGTTGKRVGTSSKDLTKAAANKAVRKASRISDTKAVKSGEKAGRAEATRLLSGGNPQIAKGYGEEPVRAYIAAMPGWKGEAGQRIDGLIGRAVPGVLKAVKWNSPLYGAPGEAGTWFMSMHCFDKYVKVAFFRGAKLTPMPPGASKQKDVRYFDVREADLEGLDERTFISWVQQASGLPGERM